jgi:hypothetical protein
MGGKDDDDRGGGMDANFTGDSCRLAMIWNQEAHLLSSQILHLRHELCAKSLLWRGNWLNWTTT